MNIMHARNNVQLKKNKTKTVHAPLSLFQDRTVYQWYSFFFEPFFSSPFQRLHPVSLACRATTPPKAGFFFKLSWVPSSSFLSEQQTNWMCSVGGVSFCWMLMYLKQIEGQDAEDVLNKCHKVYVDVCGSVNVGFWPELYWTNLL